MTRAAERSFARKVMRELALPGAPSPRLTQLAAGVDFLELEHELARQRLLGLLGSRMLSAGIDGIPEHFALAVRDSVETQRREANGHAMLTWSLLTELEAAGIRAMPLKGPFLAERLYGDMALRVSRDIDLLVSVNQLSEAIATLERIGADRLRQGEGLPELHHHFVLGAGAPIELHWRIYWFDRAYTDRILGQAIQHDGLWIPAPADELISLLLFHARDGLVGLRMPVDIAACWEQHHDAGTVTTVRAALQAFPELNLAAATAAQSVERVLGIDIATSLRLPTTRRSRLAVELTDWAIGRAPRELDLTVKLVDGLTAPHGGLGNYLRRAFMPRLEGPRGSLWRRQALYAMALLSRMMLAGWAITRELRKRPGWDSDPVGDGNQISLR